MIRSSLTNRARLILKKLIDHYILDGEPIGSQKLANSIELSLSAASIRNVMADLESDGYLESPYTSAGRVPTEKAYRFFVNALLTVKPIRQNILRELEIMTLEENDTQSQLNKVSKLLSQMTNLAGIVLKHEQNSQKLRHIEFLALSDKRILVILVLNEKDVQNRIINTDKQYTAKALEKIANFILTRYCGQELSSIRDSLLETLKNDWMNMNESMKMFFKIADSALQSNKKSDDYIISGEANLLQMAKERGFDSFKTFLEAISTQREVLRVIDQCLVVDGVNIFIGSESNCEGFKDCSFVTAPYESQNNVMGVLGVIGPMRMDYESIIPMVDVTAKLLSSTL